MKKILSILVVSLIVGMFLFPSYAGLKNTTSNVSLVQETPKCPKDTLAQKKCSQSQASMDSTKHCCKKDTTACKHGNKPCCKNMAECKHANKPCCKDSAQCKREKTDCPAKTSEAKGSCPKMTKTAQN